MDPSGLEVDLKWIRSGLGVSSKSTWGELEVGDWVDIQAGWMADWVAA